MWYFKFFKDFYSHHDAGCHDNKKKTTFDIYLTKAYQLLAYFTKLATVRVLHIPHGDWPYCAFIKTKHGSKLNWADLKIIWHYILYYILFDDP